MLKMIIPGMPDYMPEELAALDACADAVNGVLHKANYAHISPPVVEPADVFLEQSGEEIRRKIYILNDPAGRELCLRPELTIPACRQYIRQNFHADTNGITRLKYDGQVFRYQGDREDRLAQFRQAGLECLGGATKDIATLDAEVLSLTSKAIEAAGFEADATVKMGDLGLFYGLLDALDMPDQWREKLRRTFWKHDRFDKLLGQLSTDGNASSAKSGFTDGLSALGPERARDMVENVLDVAGIVPVGGRSVHEIVDRFISQAEDRAAAPLSAQTITLIKDFLNLKGKPSDVLAQIKAMTKTLGLNLNVAITVFENRMAQLNELGIGEDRIFFATEFGRTMEYYTGFVFKIDANNTIDVDDMEMPIAVGGRYDDLLQQLGADTPVIAAGCAIFIDRLKNATTNKGATS
jgi:ATP phosphoribosyltransferase regulatory subunit